MKSLVSGTAASAEQAAAQFIGARLDEAIAARGRAALAVSGGKTPWGMFDALARTAVRWEAVHLFQVDERRVPPQSSERNWTRFLAHRLASRVPAANLHPIPADIDPAQNAAEAYEHTLTEHVGEPPALDVVHLGLGPEGHTASLFPGEPLLEDQARWVGVSHSPDGLERITLTLPTLNLARHIVWFVLGEERREIVRRFVNRDLELPASRVADARAVLFTDAEAAPEP
jgi:6-phosphogluconolactonase